VQHCLVGSEMCIRDRIDSKTGKKKRQPLWFKEARSLKSDERSKVRSKTFPGIAQAMSSQWGNYLMETYRSHYA
jgi:hypothetical protein